MSIIASRSSGMLYLICKRAKPVRRSSPIVVYIEKILWPGGGFPGNVETPLPTRLVLVGIAAPSTQVFNHGGGDASRGGHCSCPDTEAVGVVGTRAVFACPQ